MPSILYALLLAGILLFSLFVPASAGQNTLPNEAPVPLARPFAPSALSKNNPLLQDNFTTAAIPQIGKPVVSNLLKSGLGALGRNEIGKAVTFRNKMTRGSLERDILNWSLATSGAVGISSTDIKDMMAALKDWPGHQRMQNNFERAVARENLGSAQKIALLGHKTPQTAAGMVALGNALVASGKTKQARAMIAPWWHEKPMSVAEEAFVLQNLSKGILKKEDHLHRLKAMLYEERFASADQLASLAEAYSLVRAFKAVARKEKGAAQKLKQVDRSWHKDAVYLFARIQYLRRSGQYNEAVKLMHKAPKDGVVLINPDTWWVERRALSREMLDLGKPKEAYKLAAAHQAKNSAQIVDAEFHAGWYALRFLKDAKTAQKHFTRMAQFSSRPISVARSFYWLGRVQEALQNKREATDYYVRAAHHGTTFYGQLAAARLGMPKLDLPYPKPNEVERIRFASSPAVQAIRHLEAAGERARALTLYQYLSEELPSSGEMTLLAIMAEKSGNYHLSLKIGKKAVVRGLSVGALSHPLGAIPSTVSLSGAGQALAYAVARQESEFNSSAVSHAGARGMLQLLPKTAKTVAAKRGIAFSAHKLGSDAAYNATLGAHFLTEQLERFQGSYILTFVGYNAGPARANAWISRYGDPRGRSIEEVVDWVERIPYTETRNYVQRVMENYQVYKARLNAQGNIAQDLTRGRRM